MSTINKAYGLEKDYFILRNKDVQRIDMSYEAVGMLSYLMSLPEDWTIYVDKLKREGCGRDKIRRIMQELQDNGYLVLVREQNAQGHIAGSHYEAYSTPEQNPHFTNRQTENPSVGLTVSRSNRQSENQQLQSKEGNKGNRVENKEKEIPPVAGQVETPIKSAKAKKSKPVSDTVEDNQITKQARQMIIVYRGYAKNPSMKFSSADIDAAIKLINENITLDDIRDYYQERSKDKWIQENRNGVVSWDILLKEIISWRDKRNHKPSALNGNGASKAIERRYVDKSGVTSVTSPEYRKQYGLPDVTESDMPDFLKEST